MKLRTAGVAGFEIVYRDAGDPAEPNIVLLHGFPSSSDSFTEPRRLLQAYFPALAARACTAARTGARFCGRPCRFTRYSGLL